MQLIGLAAGSWTPTVNTGSFTAESSWNYVKMFNSINKIWKSNQIYYFLWQKFLSIRKYYSQCLSLSFLISFQKHHKHRHQQQRLGCCLHIICEWEVALNSFVIECNPSSPLMVVNCPATLTLLRNGTICRLLSVSKKLSVQPIQRLDVGLILRYWMAKQILYDSKAIVQE